MSEIPQGLPLDFNDFSVPVRLVAGPRGVLLVEREEDTRRRYQKLLDDVEIRYATEPALAIATASRLEAARDKEISLYADVEHQCAAQIREFTFRFRVSLVEDVEAAERDALVPVPGTAASSAGSAGMGPGATRSQIAYERSLAKATFQGSDFPGFSGDFGKLRADVAGVVLGDVAARVSFSGSAVDFLSLLGTPSATETP